MADVETLRSLRERVRKATGPDRSLDADICVALGYVPGVPEAVDVSLDLYDDPGVIEFDEPGNVGPPFSDEAPPLTGSIDAAVALVKRMLPGAGGHIELPYAENAAENATAFAAIWTGDQQWEAYGSTEPLAILAAILAACLDALVAREG